MGGALFSRAKTWIFQEDVASADLNGEFDNILNNLNPQNFDGYSDNVAQMQVQTNPGLVGSESLAANTSGELARLRYVIQRIMGSSAAFWYSNPPTDLTVIKNTFTNLSLLQNGVISGAVDANGQPMYLIPDGTTNKVTLKCSITPISVYINGTQYTFSSDIALTGLTLAPAATNTAAVGTNPVGANYTGNSFTKNGGEEDSPDILLTNTSLGNQVVPNYIALTSPGASLTALDGSQVAFKLNAEYSVGVLQGVATRLESCSRGFFFDNANASLSRVSFATADTVTLMKIAYIFLLNAGSLDVTYNKPSIGGATPSAPSTGDYWYDTVNSQWKRYNGTSFVANSSVYVGACFQDASVTKGARSADFIASYSDDQNIFLKKDSLTNSKATSSPAGNISIYGQNLGLQGMILDYSVARDKEGALAAGDLLFFYLSKTGKLLISNLAPNRRPELAGYYHPSKPYRCIASGYTSDGAKLDYAIKNSKKIHEQPPRRYEKLFAGGTTNNVNGSNTAFATFKVLMRGGRLKVSTSDTASGSTLTASNGSAVVTAGTVFVDVSDEYGDSITNSALLSVATPSSGASTTTNPATSGELFLGNFSGLVTVTFKLSIAAASGTPTTTFQGGVLAEEVI